MKKHIRKIIHLIIICGIWGLGKLLILMPIKGEFLSVKEVIQGLWGWKQGWINSLWFLGALVCIYILFPLLKSAYDNNGKIFRYFVVVCAVLTFGNVLLNEGATILLTCVFNKTITLKGFNFFNIFNPFRGIFGYTFVYFCIGGCFYQIKDKILSIKPLKRNVASVVIMLISCMGLWGIGICYSKASGEQFDVVWDGYDTIFTFANVICIYVLCLNLRKDIPIIKSISCNTLGIYFIHDIFINLTRNSVKEYSYLCNVTSNILYAAAILFICLAIALIMKKIPFIRRLVS